MIGDDWKLLAIPLASSTIITIIYILWKKKERK